MSWCSTGKEEKGRALKGRENLVAKKEKGRVSSLFKEKRNFHHSYARADLLHLQRENPALEGSRVQERGWGKNRKCPSGETSSSSSMERSRWLMKKLLQGREKSKHPYLTKLREE